jgi:DNA helicase II / ATP-dependent DNA helicase PcrA
MSSIEELARDTSVFFVAGPPGCGKTTFVATQVHRAASNGKSVLLASLTKTAAHELAGRDLPIDAKRIGTLHAHALRAIGGGTVAESKAKEWNEWCDETDRPWSWHLSSARKTDVDDPMDEGATGDAENTGVKTEGDAFLEEAGTWRARAVPRAQWIARTEVIRFAEAWDEWKADTGYLDFTDMIETCLRERIPPPVEFDVMFLDETQDSSRLEVMLALQWGALGETLVVAGDVRQNLYEWRGSEPGVFLEINRICHEKRVLAQSYRVPASVHRHAVVWARQLSQDIEAEYHPRRDDNGVIEGEVVSGPSLKRAEWIVEDAAEAAERGKTVMLLGATRRLVDAYVTELRSAGLLFHNPYRPKAGHWNPIGDPLRGGGAAAQLVAFSRTNDRAWGQDARFWTPDEVKAWVKPIRAEVFERGFKSRLAAGEAVTPQQFKANVKDTATLNRMFSGDLDWYVDALTEGQRKGGRFKYPLAVAEKRGIKALTEPPKITVGTVHSVKGGESDVVYVAPDLSRAGYDSWVDKDTRDQVVRVFYVAMTRAREKLVLLRPMGGMSVDL